MLPDTVTAKRADAAAEAPSQALLHELLDVLDQTARAHLRAFDELNALRDRVESVLMTGRSGDEACRPGADRSG